jgi:oxygen-independent coproporphyrinogen-3 oxidase
LGEAGAAGSAALDGRLRLSAEGLAWSDAVGPMFFSEAVRAAMRAYELK